MNARPNSSTAFPVVRVITRLILSLCALGPVLSAQAQGDAAWPAKPVRIVVGLAAGGGTDVITRLVAQKLTERLGQPFIVENKPGTSAIVGTDYVARAQPDGYTLLVSPSGPIVMNPIMYTKLSYSPQRDFAPIALIARFPLVLLVENSRPFKSVGELVAYLKTGPKDANYSGASSAFQLAVEMFKQRTGVPLEFIPYKGSNEAIHAVLSGSVLTTLVDAGPASGPLRGGRVRGLAVTAPARMTSFPDIPTMSEAGLTGLDIQFWMGLLAPTGTPAAIVKKLEGEIAAIVRLPDVAARMRALEVIPAGSGADEFARVIASELAQWAQVAKTAGVKPAN